MSSMNQSRKETERAKLIQEKCQTLLTQMLRDEDNKYCVDCDAKGPRWASWNLGVFLCIRCAGIHRNLGVHISRVKSVNLDSWTPEQVISLQQMGNSRARAVYEAQLPDGFRRPQTDNALESFIRSKYEHKKYLAREWVPPSPPKVCWAKEIDEELEKQKRKKKAAITSHALSLSSLNTTASSEKKYSVSATKNSLLPAPLPKPKANQKNSIPKSNEPASENPAENDLLGLSSPIKPSNMISNVGDDANSDAFTNFLAAIPPVNAASLKEQGGNVPKSQSQATDSLAKEEEDFFNYGSIKSNEKQNSGKLSKDGILALYGAPTPNNMQTNFVKFTGMAPGYNQLVQPQPQHQFMTPPNSVSMYNSPVMTAPAAFTSSSLNAGNAVSAYGVPFSSSATSYTSLTNCLQPTSMNNTTSLLPPSVSAATSNPLNQQSGTAYFTQTLQGSNSPQQLTAMPAISATSMRIPNTLPIAFSKSNSNAPLAANMNQEFSNLNLGNVFP